MPAAITITAAGKDWPISMREISELRRLQRRHGTREIARHMAAMPHPHRNRAGGLGRRPGMRLLAAVLAVCLLPGCAAVAMIGGAAIRGKCGLDAGLRPKHCWIYPHVERK
jgi:hypothetical protein